MQLTFKSNRKNFCMSLNVLKIKLILKYGKIKTNFKVITRINNISLKFSRSSKKRINLCIYFKEHLAISNYSFSYLNFYLFRIISEIILSCVIFVNFCSATSKDKCETCPFDYEPNSDKSKCVPKSISNSSKNIGIVYISLVFGAALMNFLTSVTSKTTHRSIYDMVNQAQLFILLPCIGMYVPEALVEFNRVIKDGLVSFSYISNSFMPQLFSFVSSSNYSQGDSYLYLVDLTSGSSVYNTSGLYFVLFVLLLFHFASWIINDLSLKELSPKGCLKLSYYIINYLSFCIYIRLFLLSFMFILLSTFTETFNSTAMKTYKASYSYSCTILVFSVIAMIVIFIKCIIFTKDGEADSATYSKELFRGIKPTKLSRVYYAVFLLRRLLFVTIICSSSSLSPKVKLLAISGLEVIYIIYLFAARPFLSIKDTISDIFNEISWLAILSVMIYYINGDKWSNTASNSVMAIIMINISIHVLISIVGFIAGLSSIIEDKKPIPINNRPIQSSMESPRKHPTEPLSPRKFNGSDIHNKIEETKVDLAGSPSKRHANESFSILKPMRMDDFKGSLNNL